MISNWFSSVEPTMHFLDKVLLATMHDCMFLDPLYYFVEGPNIYIHKRSFLVLSPASQTELGKSYISSDLLEFLIFFLKFLRETAYIGAFDFSFLLHIYNPHTIKIYLYWYWNQAYDSVNVKYMLPHKITTQVFAQ